MSCFGTVSKFATLSSPRSPSSPLLSPGYGSRRTELCKAKGGLATNLDWIPRPGFADFVGYFVDLAGCDEFGLPARAWPLPFSSSLPQDSGLAIIRNPRKFPYRTLLFLSVLIVTPVILALAASWVLPQSVWGQKASCIHHRTISCVLLPRLLPGLAGASSAPVSPLSQHFGSDRPCCTTLAVKIKR